MTAQAPGSAGRARRDLLLLGVGQFLSIAGDLAALTALMLRLQPLGPGWIAALLAAEFAPSIVLAGLAGRLVDRIETRRLLLVALTAQAVLAAPLALSTSPWLTVVLFTLLCSFGSLVRPAVNALVPSITGADRGAHGYARLGIAYGLGVVLGPGIGGLLTTLVGSTVALLADGASFLVLAAACFLLHARRLPQASRAKESGGLRILMTSRVLRGALTVSAIATACAVVDNVAGPDRFVVELGAGDLGYGLYLSIWGAGALAGSQLLSRIPSSRHAPALGVANALMGLGIAGIGAAPAVWVALLASLLGGVGNGFVNVTQNTLVAEHTPSAAHGRAFAASSAVLQTAIGAGTLLGAPLVASTGAGRAMVLAGTIASLVAAAGTLWLIRTSRIRPSPLHREPTPPGSPSKGASGT